MSKLYSYVVEHDYGFAPNPSGGYCTLALCKHRKPGSRQRNIVELAEKGDWLVGTGGVSGESAGHGMLIYAMRVDEKLILADYFKDARFQGRINKNHEEAHRTDTFALISEHYYYFGRNAIAIGAIPKRHLSHLLEKKGPGFRCDFSVEFIEEFAGWLESNYPIGKHGEPCVAPDEVKEHDSKGKQGGCKKPESRKCAAPPKSACSGSSKVSSCG